jgi:hypothetical protein
MEDQPVPKPGREKVAYRAWWEFWKALKHQYQKGLEHYKTPLMTHNGRDAGTDAMQEMADAVMYVQQLRMEHEDCKRENEALRGRLGQLSTPERGDAQT